MKVILAQINPIIGDLAYNREKIIDCIQKAKKKKADLILFHEMILSGYPPEDLLLLPSFIESLQKELIVIQKQTQGIAAIVGTVRENPTRMEKGLYNTAAIFEDGELLGFQDKRLLPEYDVFSERRYFEPGNKSHIWEIKGKKCAVTICEDIWQHGGGAAAYSIYPIDPVLAFKDKEIDLFFNLSASPFYLGRQQMRLALTRAVAKTLSVPVLLCNSVGGNDSLLFDGHSHLTGSTGELLAIAKGFEEELLFVDTEEKKTAVSLTIQPAEDLFRALKMGLKDYFQKMGFTKALIGLSGGIDSALVAVIAQEALGKENVLALFMPSRYTSEESFRDAKELAGNLEIAIKEISIEPSFRSFLDLLAPHFAGKAPDITEENLQARIRGMILMAFSNKFGYLVLSTGNKSEMAMGYSTLYGDMCGGLSVLGDVTKEQVYLLAKWINREKEIIPQAIIEKAPSAELKPNQKDSDTLPEYPIVDLVLREYVEEHRSPEEIASIHQIPIDLVRHLVHVIHQSEYKRRQAPPSLRVTKRSFSIGRRFPIVQHWNREQKAGK